MLRDEQMAMEEQAALEEEEAERTKTLEVLAQLGIECFEMTWQHYKDTEHPSSDLFDAIITEPPNGVCSSRSTPSCAGNNSWTYSRMAR